MAKVERFRHNFENGVNPFCTCSLDFESTKHLFTLQLDKMSIIPQKNFKQLIGCPLKKDIISV